MNTHQARASQQAWWRIGFALLVLTLAPGCVTQMVAKRIVDAPNRQGVPRQLRDQKMLDATDKFFVQAWRLPIASPAAELSVGVLDPGGFTFTYSVQEKPTEEGGRTKLVYRFTWKQVDVAAATSPPLKGTLVLLHGIMMTKETLFPWALFFAQEGYRVVLVDLRGHGRSTGAWLGYGAWEAGDLVELTNDLERRGLIAGKLGVFGISYGGVMGIHWAARDSRVAAVVALAPFSDPQKAIVDFARGVMPKLAARLSEARFAEAAARAAAMAGFKWSDVSVVDATKRLRVPVHFFHGRDDEWIPPSHSAELLRVAKRGSRRRLSDDDHMTLTVRHDTVGRDALIWFGEKLGGEAGAAEAVKPDTAQQ